MVRVPVCKTGGGPPSRIHGGSIPLSPSGFHAER